MAIRISGMISGLDTDALVKELTSAYSVKKDKMIKAQKLNQMKQDVWKDINKSVYNFYTGSLSKARLSGNYKSTQLMSTDTGVAASLNGKINGSTEVRVQQLATKTYVTGSKINQDDWPLGADETLTVKIGGREQEINITGNMTATDVAKKLTDVGLEANFDEKTGRLFIASVNQGDESVFNISGNADVMRKLGLGEDAAVSLGHDAIAYVNGAQFKQNHNNFELNGLKFTATGIGSTTIKNETNNAAFDTIKSFVNDYNDLIKKLSTHYNAASIKGFDPLTEDEESAMTDKQVEKWNEKINEGCLRKDPILGNLITSLRSNILTSVEIDGKKYSLSSMGIKSKGYFTGDANERNILEIDEDKLKSFLSEHPEDSISIASKVAGTIYEKLSEKMKSTSLHSAYTIYNDKEMQKEYNSYNDKIKKWEDKISTVEDKYYKQFAVMEKTLAKLQSNSSGLANLFG